MPRRSFFVLPILTLVVGLAACGADSDSAADTTSGAAATSTLASTTTTAPTTVQGRLAQAYPDAAVDPSAAAWQALLDDETLAAGPISVIEFAHVADDDGRAQYTAFVDAVETAAAAGGGSLVAVTDIWRAGLELPQGFDDGMVWAASFPSRDTFVEVMLDPAVVAAAVGRRAAITDPHLLVGVNLLPEFILELQNPDDVEALPHALVRGRSVDDLVSELLTIYPDGGADPPRDVLEAMLSRPDVRTQAITYVNLYQFNETDTGAEAITEYNAEALPYVLAHGARPKLMFNVAQQLLGTSTWNRVILVRWPSLEVFTDLRLTPEYFDAQISRVTSSSAYGNLVTINRADRI